MWNPRDPERALYIYHARKDDKRTFVDIGQELGISPERVRQMYRRMDWAINRENADHHIKKVKREAAGLMKGWFFSYGTVWTFFKKEIS